jgi:competence protein ComEA
VDHPENDGDTFHARRDGKEFIFRLYCVDAPETDSTLPERVAEQAAYFGVPRAQVLEIGREARRYAADFLKEGFTAVTSWQKARGPGTKERFFALLLVGESDLAKELVKQGLVRIHGPAANWPETSKAAVALRELRSAESAAKTQGLGGWKKASALVAASPPRSVEPLAAQTPPVPAPSAPIAPALAPAAETLAAPEQPPPAEAPAAAESEIKPVDLNAASKAELETIPGIGPVLAERIIAGRPYGSVDELSRVKGIKARMLEKVRPFVTVGR